ncbi:MAG: hypothetical protein H6766_01920 [Candidatus Peribacteria bacterium]|nr:MAG: hypothetical protein H6766_01920 [Candidatus Peribacteria bacterium]
MLVRQVIQKNSGMSRRKCFSLFCDGKVSVNNVICKDFKSICQTGDLITRSDQGHHAITINNNSEKEQIEGDIIIFYKPTGYVVSRNDHFNDTIYSLLPPEYALHYRPVGRLDKDTS